MVKNRMWWSFGDACTKIGGGVFGGVIVGYYFNQFIIGQPLNLFPAYYFLLGFGVFLLVVGYVLIKKAR